MTPTRGRTSIATIRERYHSKSSTKRMLCMDDTTQVWMDVHTLLGDLDRAAATVQGLREAVELTVKALKAQIQMRDMKSPRKLEEHLCWRENDELAASWAEQALEQAKHALEQAQAAGGEHGQ